MSLNTINKPKTHKGRRILEQRAPRIIENDKCTLVLKGGNTNRVVTAFLDEICTLKKPLVKKLKWRNPVLPFTDMSFIENMCRKYDCSLFILGLHSKKRPNNVVFGRLYDGELLDMFEMGVTNFDSSMKSQRDAGVFGSKPMLLFSGELFDESRQFVTLRSLLTDIFRGPAIEKVRTLGIEHQLHFTLFSEQHLTMRFRRILYEKSKTKDLTSESSGNMVITDSLPTPWGSAVHISLQDVGENVDFELRRVNLPSEEKWKRAHRIPHETRITQKKTKNRHTDVFGSRIGRVNVGKLEPLDKLRPGASLRTALTGRRKQGFSNDKPTGKRRLTGNTSDPSPGKKRLRSLQ